MTSYIFGCAKRDKFKVSNTWNAATELHSKYVSFLQYIKCKLAIAIITPHFIIIIWSIKNKLSCDLDSTQIYGSIVFANVRLSCKFYLCHPLGEVYFPKNLPDKSDEVIITNYLQNKHIPGVIK